LNDINIFDELSLLSNESSNNKIIGHAENNKEYKYI
jgi:hypothetical protein